jgi:hypothetical protein
MLVVVEHVKGSASVCGDPAPFAAKQGLEVQRPAESLLQVLATGEELLELFLVGLWVGAAEVERDPRGGA